LPPDDTRSTVRDLPADLAIALERTAAARGSFGQRVAYFAEIGSTNDVAIRAADAGEPEGSLYLAGTQTAGRGRLGRTWLSPPGAGLYASIILRRREIVPWITLAGGVAVAEGIRSATGLPVQIKWPNDIVAVSGQGFRGRRKLGGILAEASSGSSGVQYVVLGFGVNLRQASLPPDLADRVTSIEAELGRPIDGGPVLAESLVALNAAANDIAANGAADLLARWLALAPSARGASVEWDSPAGIRQGTTAGLASDGALLVRTASGVERILSGEVRWK
jgi:BirA family biotin operon repressor/biotin-[acetyl-CoA-carboxylase] ligase